MRRSALFNRVSFIGLATALASGAAGLKAAPALAACAVDASGNATCTGTVTAPLTVYDGAAQVQPVNGSNAYTPATYNQNPPTIFVTINTGATLAITTNSTAALADRGIVAANYSNAENPAVNNVTVNNFGTVALTTGQIASRVNAVVADSQVNTFTVDNAATAAISAKQTFFTTFNPALLSTAASGTPSTYAARYNGAALNIVSALYSDDNTNEFAVNNSGAITATGRFAAAYYGRADTTIANSGTFGNLNWTATDKISDGHWAIGTYAGADFATVAGSNPDTPLYAVTGITTNAQGVRQGSLAVTDTVATTLTNNAGATISGDILVLDTNPLVVAAAAAKGQALPLAVSGSNSGPRDSNIANAGTINGNLYLGSGDHTIDNMAGATLNGSITVDQRASVGSFAVGTPGTVAGTYASAGPATTSSTGSACPAAGTNTGDPYCAATTNVLASFYGARQLALANEGTFTGNITINDQPGSTNDITLTGTGFTGSVTALNGTGSNSLTLSGVTNLAGVRNFSSIDFMQSNVAVSNGITLVDDAQINTTIFGPGGSAANPSANLGSVQGNLTLLGDANITPTFAAIARNGDVYALATTASVAGTVTVDGTDLVSFTPNTANGGLALQTTVRDARTVAGITTPGGQTINGLLSYGGSNAQLQALGAGIESLATDAQVAAAGRALAPITNGADIQIPINAAMLFHQQVDARLDSFVYAQLPSTGRSADLGPSRPVPVYGALPTSSGWIEGIEGGVTQSTRDGVSGYNAQVTGVIGGFDRLVTPNLRVGGAFGYLDARVNENSDLLGNREGIQTYQGLAYATYVLPRFYVRASVGGGGVDYSENRAISFTDFADQAFGHHTGSIVTARGEAGSPLEAAGNLLLPYGAFTYSHLSQGGYAETSGNGAGLSYNGVGNDSERAEVGGKLVVPIAATAPVFSFLFPTGSVLAIQARAAYVHEFGDVAQRVSASFTGGGDVFIATGPNPGRDMVDYGVGLSAASGPVVIDATYSGLARASYLQQVGLLRLRYVF